MGPEPHFGYPWFRLHALKTLHFSNWRFVLIYTFSFQQPEVLNEMIQTALRVWIPGRKQWSSAVERSGSVEIQTGEACFRFALVLEIRLQPKETGLETCCWKTRRKTLMEQISNTMQTIQEITQEEKNLETPASRRDKKLPTRHWVKVKIMSVKLSLWSLAPV